MPKCISNKRLEELEKDLKGIKPPISLMFSDILAAILELKRCRKLLKKHQNKENIMPKLVILRNIERGNKFFTTFKEGVDPTTLLDGTVAYEIVGYTDSCYEVWLQWYGKEVADKLLKESKY